MTTEPPSAQELKRTNLSLKRNAWIKARACLPLLLHQLAKTGQDKFAVLFNLFVGERAEL